jgi:hypothetical protein
VHGSANGSHPGAHSSYTENFCEGKFASHLPNFAYDPRVASVLAAHRVSDIVFGSLSAYSQYVRFVVPGTALRSQRITVTHNSVRSSEMLAPRGNHFEDAFARTSILRRSTAYAHEPSATHMFVSKRTRSAWTLSRCFSCNAGLGALGSRSKSDGPEYPKHSSAFARKHR